jgi:hypothetical protein
VKWANKAAEQGIFEAMTALSYGYLKITGNLPDHHDVGGHLAAYVSIQRWRRRLDEWIEPNYELGIEWLQKLASTRVDKVNALLIWDSQYYLARCYEDGRGTNKRVIDAYKWSLIASRVRKFARDTEIDRLQDNIDTLTQARIGDEMRESMIADNEKWIREHKTLFERSLNRDLESISEVQDKLAVSMTNDQISTATGLAADWWEEHIN